MSKAITPDQLKTLEQMRQRLYQLSNSIQTLQAELEHAQPVPSWPSLQSSAQLLSYNLQQTAYLLDAHRPFLRAAHAYPLPTFPGHTHPFILETLLSKKLSPRADEWIDEIASKHGPPVNPATRNAQSDASGRLQQDDLLDLWSWAGPAESQVVRQLLEDGDFEDDFTLAEREQGVELVVTGLRRKLDVGSDDEDNEDGDEDAMQTDQTAGEKAVQSGVDPTRPALPLGSVLRFLSTGDVHGHVPSYRG